MRNSSLAIFLIIFFCSSLSSKSLPFGPLPLEGQIQNNKNEELATVRIYNGYVEVISLQGEILGTAGVLPDEGRAKVFISSADTSLMAYAIDGLLYDMDDLWIASYALTPTFSYAFDPNEVRLGRVKCLAWQSICAAAATAYFLKLF